MAAPQDDRLRVFQAQGRVMSDALLLRHRDVWSRKPILRALYRHWYREIASHLKPGPTVEIGGGTGNLKEFAPNVICTDLVPTPWLDAVADAQRLPFGSRTLSNMVLFDALHHIEQIRLFFDEAVRVLCPGGRIVLMDPYISWLSWPVYQFLHSEPVDLRQDPMSVETFREGRKPFDSNQAVALIVCGVVGAMLIAPAFLVDMRRALHEPSVLGVDERLTDVRVDQISWLAEQKGGRWGRYGWYLGPGEQGHLRLSLPGSKRGNLKLRLWVFAAGPTRGLVVDFAASREIPTHELDGHIITIPTSGSAAVVPQAG